MIQNNPTNYRTAAGQYRRVGVNGIFMGLLLVAMGGAFLNFGRDDFGTFVGALFVGMGLLVCINGANTMWTSHKYMRMARDASDQKANPATESIR